MEYWADLISAESNTMGSYGREVFHPKSFADKRLRRQSVLPGDFSGGIGPRSASKDRSDLTLPPATTPPSEGPQGQSSAP